MGVWTRGCGIPDSIYLILTNRSQTRRHSLTHVPAEAAVEVEGAVVWTVTREWPDDFLLRGVFQFLKCRQGRLGRRCRPRVEPRRRGRGSFSGTGRYVDGPRTVGPERREGHTDSSARGAIGTLVNRERDTFDLLQTLPGPETSDLPYPEWT